MNTKIRHIAALASIILASCAPDMTTINSANARAKQAAKRAETAQLEAEHSAVLSAKAVEPTKSADYLVFKGGGSEFAEGPLYGGR